MQKLIMGLSYWVGVTFVALAVIVRLGNMLGMSLVLMQTRGNSISFHSFLDGAVLALLTAMATAGYSWFKKQNS
jgi:hypothetical protein